MSRRPPFIAPPALPYPHRERSTAELRAVTGSCYWGIYRSGSNGSDIIDYDNVRGGFPTVTLSEGQDFTNNRCGTFVKQ